MYKPEIIAGKVKYTGYPIDGHVLYFAQWDYDRENWHLYGWDDDADEAVMLTMFEQAEKKKGLTLETFTEKWKAKLWRPDAPFALLPDLVEVIEVKQPEEKSDAREQLIASGFDLTPRRSTDTGGILCLPMEKNLHGDIKAKHPDWELIQCPHCGRNCWKTPEAEKMERLQGAQLLCTECALAAELIAPYHNQPPAPNRAQRRTTKEETPATLTLQTLNKYREKLTGQQYKTLRGQILSGDRKCAAAGLKKIIERATK